MLYPEPQITVQLATSTPGAACSQITHTHRCYWSTKLRTTAAASSSLRRSSRDLSAVGGVSCRIRHIFDQIPRACPAPAHHRWLQQSAHDESVCLVSATMRPCLSAGVSVAWWHVACVASVVVVVVVVVWMSACVYACDVKAPRRPYYYMCGLRDPMHPMHGCCFPPLGRSDRLISCRWDASVRRASCAVDGELSRAHRVVLFWLWMVCKWDGHMLDTVFLCFF